MESDAPKPRRAAGKAAGGKDGKAKEAKVWERPRGGPAKAIADLTPQIGRAAFRRFGFVQSSVLTRWPEIVGDRHAAVCRPEAIRFAPGEKRDGILQLVVAPAHAPIIQHEIPQIVERVNRFFGYGAVAKVKLRQGAVQAPGALASGSMPAKAPPSLKSPALKPVPIELGDSLRDIGDPELRAVLENLARSLGGPKEDR